MSIRGQWFINGCAYLINAACWAFVAKSVGMAMLWFGVAIVSLYIAKRSDQ